MLRKGVDIDIAIYIEEWCGYCTGAVYDWIDLSKGGRKGVGRYCIKHQTQASQNVTKFSATHFDFSGFWFAILFSDMIVVPGVLVCTWYKSTWLPGQAGNADMIGWVRGLPRRMERVTWRDGMQALSRSIDSTGLFPIAFSRSPFESVKVIFVMSDFGQKYTWVKNSVYTSSATFFVLSQSLVWWQKLYQQLAFNTVESTGGIYWVAFTEWHLFGGI